MLEIVPRFALLLASASPLLACAAINTPIWAVAVSASVLGVVAVGVVVSE